MINALNSALRRLPAWPLYIFAVFPVIWLFYQGSIGALGVDPVKAIEHQMGRWGLQLLIVGLLISPLWQYVGLNLLKFRRAIGVITFFYIAVHLLVWLVLDVQIVNQVIADIAKRPYITIGMGAFVLMVPLVLTSNNTSVRRLGRNWARLHKLVYPIAVLGGIHYVMLVKGWQIQPMIYLVIIICLILLRGRKLKV